MFVHAWIPEVNGSLIVTIFCSTNPTNNHFNWWCICLGINLMIFFSRHVSEVDKSKIKTYFLLCSLTLLENNFAWGHGLFLDRNDVIHWEWTLRANVSVNNLSESTLLLPTPSLSFIHSISLFTAVSLSSDVSVALCFHIQILPLSS